MGNFAKKVLGLLSFSLIGGVVMKVELSFEIEDEEAKEKIKEWRKELLPIQQILEDLILRADTEYYKRLYK